MKRLFSSHRPGLFTCLAIAAVVAAELQAGIVTRTNGTQIEGELAFIAGQGLLLTDAKGNSELVVPSANRSVEIQAQDPIWSESFREQFKSGSGLLGTYFERTNLDGPNRTRVDQDVYFNWKTGSPFKGWRDEHFSVRWTGTFEVPHTGDHRFFTESDDGVRLTINGKQLINNWSEHAVTEDKTKVQLEAGKRHEIQIEYYESTGDSIVQVQWEGPEHKRQNLGTLELFPPPGALSGYNAPSLSQTGLRVGVVLRDGTFLAARVHRANDTAVVLEKPFSDVTISTVNVARIVFRDIPLHTAVKVRPQRPGALMVGGDFVDGEFKSLERGNLKLSSLLFGYQTLDTKYETMALQLRVPAPDTASYRIQLLDGSLLLGTELTVGEDSVSVSGSILKNFEVPLTQVHRIAMGSAPELFPSGVNLGPDSIHAEKLITTPSASTDRRQTDNLRKLAQREKDKRSRDKGSVESKMRAEDAALKLAKAKLADYRSQLEAAEEKYAAAGLTYTESLARYEVLFKGYNETNSLSRRLSQDYSRARSAVSKAASNARRATGTMRDLQTQMRRYTTKAHEKTLKALKAKLVKVEQDVKATAEAVKKHNAEQKEVTNKRNQTTASVSKLKRDLSRRKSDRDRRKRDMDSARKKRDYLKSQVTSHTRTEAAAMAKVVARKETELR
ncbi:MAG: hypothetical protein ACI91J_003487 [Yoonia sp.]|jgi:hypothetical protein